MFIDCGARIKIHIAIRDYLQQRTIVCRVEIKSKFDNIFSRGESSDQEQVKNNCRAENSEEKPSVFSVTNCWLQ